MFTTAHDRKLVGGAMYDLARWQSRHWIKGTRVYAATLHQTLFGDWQVQRQWSGKGRHGGRTLTLPASNYCEAVSLLEATATRRTRRGYTETEA